ncbi:MAG TPA: hypothetical protein VM487_03265 [Phycisphaerae bacterium]|nr:hypothetical protein [Phycisphaerae bacterium]
MSKKWTGGSAALLAALAVSASAFANVDLLFDPPAQVVPPDSIVEINLVAASDNDEEAIVGAIDAILIWDPIYLELLGTDDSNGPYDWFKSGFPLNPDGLNEGVEVPWVDVPDNDGDAIYTALARPGDPAMVPPPPGLIVTTIRFQALAETAETTLSFLPEYGQYSFTRVLQPPNQDITGDISSVATITIVCGCVGDLDGDCDVDHSDLGILLASWQIDDGGDLDGDFDTDHSDLGILLGDWQCGVSP